MKKNKKLDEASPKRSPTPRKRGATLKGSLRHMAEVPPMWGASKAPPLLIV